jgi:excisionase family DNA binding protein
MRVYRNSCYIDGAMVDIELLTVAQTAQALALSRTTIYALLEKGDLESVWIGTARRIPYDSLSRFIERLRKEQRISA